MDKRRVNKKASDFSDIGDWPTLEAKEASQAAQEPKVTETPEVEEKPSTNPPPQEPEVPQVETEIEKRKRGEIIFF